MDYAMFQKSIYQQNKKETIMKIKDKRLYLKQIESLENQLLNGRIKDDEFHNKMESLKYNFDEKPKEVYE
jgi:hypothetical protein